MSLSKLRTSGPSTKEASRHTPMQLNLRGQRMAGGKADVGTYCKSLQVHKEDRHISVQVKAC